MSAPKHHHVYRTITKVTVMIIQATLKKRTCVCPDKSICRQELLLHSPDILVFIQSMAKKVFIMYELILPNIFIFYCCKWWWREWDLKAHLKIRLVRRDIWRFYFLDFFHFFLFLPFFWISSCFFLDFCPRAFKAHLKIRLVLGDIWWFYFLSASVPTHHITFPQLDYRLV